MQRLPEIEARLQFVAGEVASSRIAGVIEELERAVEQSKTARINRRDARQIAVGSIAKVEECGSHRSIWTPCFVPVCYRRSSNRQDRFTVQVR
jgi:hypothetical protein